MRIDEEEVYDLSHNNLTEGALRVQEEKRECKKNGWIEREYFRADKPSLEIFRKIFENMARNKVESIGDLEEK